MIYTTHRKLFVSIAVALGVLFGGKAIAVVFSTLARSQTLCLEQKEDACS